MKDSEFCERCCCYKKEHVTDLQIKLKAMDTTKSKAFINLASAKNAEDWPQPMHKNFIRQTKLSA